MKTEADRLWPALFHGWVELLTLFLFLFVALTLWGWAHNRGFRPADRGPNTPWLLLLITFALMLVLRVFEDAWPQAATIATALAVAGWVGKPVRERALWIPALLLAILTGMDLMLSAIVLAAVGFIVLLLSARRS